MAATKEVHELTEKIFDETYMALKDSFTERVRQLGDSACKAGIETAIMYLSEKPELFEEELEKLSVGKIPEDYEQEYFEKHIEQLNARANVKLNEKERALCYDAFDSGIGVALSYLVKTAKFKGVDLLSLIPILDKDFVD